MAKLKLWSDNKTKDYKFVDRIVQQYFNVSGTKVYIHKLVGHYDDNGEAVDNKIQDLLFMENRDRKYSAEVYCEYAIYDMSDYDFDLSVFGFMAVDTLFMDFHLNGHAENIGRKLAAGDVLELVHLRDDMLEGKEGAINSFFVVEDGKRNADGYDARWLPHVWRVRIKKMTGGKEYNDILENHVDGIENLMAQYEHMISIDDAVNKEAEANVPSNSTSNDYEYNYRYDGALEPEPNINIEDLRKVTVFPADAQDGEYVIRTDYEPMQVFKYTDGKWVLVNIQNLLKKWVRGHEYTTTFTENSNTTKVDNEIRPEKTYITRPVDIPIDDDNRKL